MLVYTGYPKRTLVYLYGLHDIASIPFVLSKIAIEMDSMIEIRNGSKSYGNGKNALLVLDNFTMTINKGSM